MSVKTVLVGQAPSRTSEPDRPLSGMSGKRLAGLLRMTEAELSASFCRINLVDEFPGKNGKGDAFPAAEARTKALLLMKRYAGRRVTLVLAGKKVAGAFGLRGRDYFERGRFHEFPNIGFVTVPHPSGVNRWWNDAGNRRKAAKFFAELRKATKSNSAPGGRGRVPSRNNPATT